MKKETRKLLLLGGTLILFQTVLILAADYLLDYSLKPEHEGRNVAASWQMIRKDYPYIAPWTDSLQQHQALRDTFLTAPDGTRLHAYYARAACPTRRATILIHGYTDNAVRMMPLGYLYHHDMGCHILLPDLRNSGQSQGDHFQMGWLDRHDVRLWGEMAHRLFGDSVGLVVHGVSMGAATTMMLSGDTLPDYFRCFVEDCGYTSVWDQFEKELGERFYLPSFPLMQTADALCRIRYGWSFREASALEQVRKCRRPMLFIHGSADHFVPTRMVRTLYDAKPQPKELWIAPNTPHALSYKQHRATYTLRVRDFVNRYMTPGR